MASLMQLIDRRSARKPRDRQSYFSSGSIPFSYRCTSCEIGIFDNAEEAAEFGVTIFDLLVNLRVGDLCVGCAGANLETAQFVELSPAEDRAGHNGKPRFYRGPYQSRTEP